MFFSIEGLIFFLLNSFFKIISIVYSKGTLVKRLLTSDEIILYPSSIFSFLIFLMNIPVFKMLYINFLSVINRAFRYLRAFSFKGRNLHQQAQDRLQTKIRRRCDSYLKLKVLKNFAIFFCCCFVLLIFLFLLKRYFQGIYSCLEVLIGSACNSRKMS